MNIGLKQETPEHETWRPPPAQPATTTTHVKIPKFVDHEPDFGILGLVDLVHKLAVVGLQAAERRREKRGCHRGAIAVAAARI